MHALTPRQDDLDSVVGSGVGEFNGNEQTGR
jgi:hypothetical protein